MATSNENIAGHPKKQSFSKTRGKQQDKKRSYLSQEDVPSMPLEQALRAPRAIAEQYASAPVTPLQLATALNMTPNSSTFRMLCGAAIAYGLTSGGYNAAEIKLESLGRRIVRPLIEGDDITAKREAFLQPRVNGEFLRKYNGHAVPRDDIAKNVLADELDVPKDKTEDVLLLILNEADALGLLTNIKGKKYVNLNGLNSPSKNGAQEDNIASTHDGEEEPIVLANDSTSITLPSIDSSNEIVKNQTRKRRVFITHGKNKSFVEPIKKLLQFGELEPVVSIERQSVSQPVSDKVLGDMRSCGAAIIHVDAEQKLLDQDAKEQLVLNPNVLIEIGASMALYGRRFIFLVKDGISLPSNLQGLYEVRYSGETLDGDATIKLLEAINAMKNHPFPNDGFSKDGSTSVH